MSVVTLPAGPAVGMRAMAELKPDKRRSLVVDVVEYWVPVPGEPDILLLNFSTPVLVLADILAEIADDIARDVAVHVMNGKVRRRVVVEGRLVTPVAGSGSRGLPIHTGYAVFDAVR